MKKIKCKYCEKEFEKLKILQHISSEHQDAAYGKLKVLNIEQFNKKKEEISLLNIVDLKDIVIKKFFSKNGRLSPNYRKKFFIDSIGENTYENIFYYSNFLKINSSFKERIYCIINNIYSYKICECGNEIKKFQNLKGFSDWKYTNYCSQSCANKFTNYKRDSEFYKNVSKKIVHTRKGKNNYILTDEMNIALWTNSAREKRNNTNIKKYGVKNPGVLGAYSSKVATQFIKNFLKENNISEDRCFYKNKETNKNEFYQMIEIGEIKKYISYDLVVFSDIKSAEDKNKNNIDLILEYNGPWHYKEEEIVGKELEKANPYKNSPTKIEVFNNDTIKLNHMKLYTKEILIYWEKDKKIETYFKK